MEHYGRYQFTVDTSHETVVCLPFSYCGLGLNYLDVDWGDGTSTLYSGVLDELIEANGYDRKLYESNTGDGTLASEKMLKELWENSECRPCTVHNYTDNKPVHQIAMSSDSWDKIFVGPHYEAFSWRNSLQCFRGVFAECEKANEFWRLSRPSLSKTKVSKKMSINSEYER